MSKRIVLVSLSGEELFSGESVLAPRHDREAPENARQGAPSESGIFYRARLTPHPRPRLRRPA